MPKLLGGTDTLTVGKKTYVVGDNVPIGQKEAEHMARYAGLHFEGIDTPALRSTVTDVRGMVFDERGQAQVVETGPTSTPEDKPGEPKG